MNVPKEDPGTAESKRKRTSGRKKCGVWNWSNKTGQSLGYSCRVSSTNYYGMVVHSSLSKRRVLMWRFSSFSTSENLNVLVAENIFRVLSVNPTRNPNPDSLQKTGYHLTISKMWCCIRKRFKSFLKVTLSLLQACLFGKPKELTRAQMPKP